MKKDFESQESQFREYKISLTEKGFEIESAKKYAKLLTDRVNISAVKIFIKDSAVKIEEGTNSLTSEINSILPPIDVEKSTFDAIEENQQFNFLKSEEGRGFLKNFINSETTKLKNNQEFTKEQSSIKENLQKEMESAFISTELEKLKSDLTSKNLLLNGSEELKSLEKKLSDLKALESKFFEKKLAEKLKQHEFEFLTKITSDNLTKILEIAAEEASKGELSTLEHLYKELSKQFEGYNSIDNLVAVASFFMSCLLASKPFFNDESKILGETSNTLLNPNPTFKKGVQEVITMVNDKAKEDEEKTKEAKTFQAKDWFNNKKLLRALEKVADCDFYKLKKALNSNEDIRDNKFLKELELTSGDLSVLDAIDELHDTKRAKDKFIIKDQNVDRENLKMMMQSIPKDAVKREELFKLTKEQNFDLNIKIEPSTSPTPTEAEQFLQKTNLQNILPYRK
jgi:hypothetical protein